MEAEQIVPGNRSATGEGTGAPPGTIRWTGRARGAGNDDVWGRIGGSAGERAALRDREIV
ncbi:hypothetical protein FE391_35895 [Nonomuraea sp. KC401]|uniref:hypothetical protein n=1 Tax=unclassified Nonomuraea TaxID=2593643 RepID=UPI0010FF5625|nr:MULTISPECIES: hypothetical protein [unclassified Nonomuraea]NBE99003.1 hypothetical protein [Nonomuraea sp. K271]TLF58906.1 hypothetical protein FE391_35895 [Nonomuraea sp. KC401]